MSSRDRALLWALVVNFAVHGLALVSMALLLLPMLPGGSGGSDAARIAMIADHPWRFRIGWMPWQACAVADVALAIAMVRVSWISGAGAIAVLVFTLAAVGPDQYGQALWITRGVELARSNDLGAYLAFEREIFPLTAGWGALFYTCAALAWTWCFARAGTWSRTLTILSVPLWSTMIVAVISPILPVSMRPSPSFVSTANGFGFIQLQLWLGLVAWAVKRKVTRGSSSVAVR